MTSTKQLIETLRQSMLQKPEQWEIKGDTANFTADNGQIVSVSASAVTILNPIAALAKWEARVKYQMSLGFWDKRNLRCQIADLQRSKTQSLIDSVGVVLEANEELVGEEFNPTGNWEELVEKPDWACPDYQMVKIDDFTYHGPDNCIFCRDNWETRLESLL